jgi:hypothetical protein
MEGSMATWSVRIVVALIGAIAAVLATALPSVLDRGSDESEAITYTGRVRNEVGGEFLRGVEVSIDARIPKTSYTDNQGIYSVSIRREDLGRDVKLHFRADGFEPNERSVAPIDERIEDIRLQPVRRPSRSPQSAAPASVPTAAVRRPAATSNPATEDTVSRPSRTAAPVVPTLINEGARGTASRAVLFGDSTGRVDASVTSRVATALGATDSLFTPAFADQLFRAVQAGQLDSLRGLRLEHIGAIALGLISTRTEARNVNGAEFTEARAEIGVRVVYPARDFAARLIAVEDRGTGFTPTSATQAAVDRAVAKAIGELKSLF